MRCRTCGRTLVSDRIWRAYTKEQRDELSATHARKQGDHCASCVRRANEKAKLGKPCKVGGCTEQVVARGYCRPHYRRYRGQGADRTRRPQPVIHFDDVEWLAETGETAEIAAHRLGITRDSLYRYLTRVERVDLWDRMRARERDWEAVA